MTEKIYPPFIMELVLVRTGTRVTVTDPMLITNKLVNEAWVVLGSLLESAMDRQGLELDDEDARELFIDLCYKLILREMTTLKTLPVIEQNLGLIPETRPLFIEAAKRQAKKQKGENTDG